MSLMFKQLRISLLLTGLMVLGVSHGFAQETRVEAEVSSRRVVLGSAIQLTITIHNGKNIEPIQWPEMDGFDVQYFGPSTQVSIVNGHKTSSKAFMYSLFSLKEGKFQIPTINVVASGKVYKIDPIDIEVVSPNDQSSSSAGDQPASLDDKIFIRLKTPKQEIYHNQQLPIKILMFVSGLSVRDIQYPQIENIGFSIEAYDKPRQYQRIINGVRHDIVEFNTVIYPTRTGELKLGPAVVECNIVVPSSGGRSRFGRGSSVFDDSFFNSIFDRQDKRPMLLTSEEVILQVLPLPEEGNRANFSGAVGEFGLNVSVSPTDIKEGDPITLKVDVLGQGNLSAIQMPSLPLSAPFKLYDPQISENGDAKKSEQVIIPKSDELKEVPAIEFSYFDPNLKKYRTITRGPFPITITKLDRDEEFRVVGLEGAVRVAETETFGEDIVFIKSWPGKLRIKGQHVYNGFLFYGLIVFAVILWLAALIHYERTNRIKTDIVYARRLQAPRQAKKGLARAKGLIASEQAQEFYDEVFKTIQHYLGNKFHLSSGAITFEAVETRLASENIEPKIMDDLKLTFSECDMIRYAAGDITQDNMTASYQRLAQIIDYLERSIK